MTKKISLVTKADAIYEVFLAYTLYASDHFHILFIQLIIA